MNSELAEINKTYNRVQTYVDPTVDELYQILLNDSENFKQKKSVADEEYNNAQNILFKILPKLTNEEIIEAYQEGCRLFQRNLSGFMANNFSKQYVTTMVDAINTRHAHTSWLFLQALADNLPVQELMPILNSSIKFEELRETTISIIKQLKIKEMSYELNLVANSNDNSKELAKDVLTYLNSI